MPLSSWARAMAHHSMRAYFIPLVASLALIFCVFLPWVVIGRYEVKGFPDLLSLWILGLGGLGLLLAVLSIITRKNSRHPLLVVGLAALGIMFTAY
ncbi:MAG: hypothetical protein ACRD1T_11960, partial [Acidimicrobiia bacterium]